MSEQDEELSKVNSGNSIIVLLRPLPPQLTVVKDMIESLGYMFFSQSSPEFSQMNLIIPPKIAIMPIGTRTTLSQLKNELDEYAQTFGDHKTTVLSVYCGKMSISAKGLESIGLKHIFQSPIEDEELINKIFEVSPVETEVKSISLSHLVRANIVDLEKMKTLPFDLFLYLPMNSRAVLYMTKGSALDEKTIAKFKKNTHYNLFIQRVDFKKYQDYAQEMIVDFSEGEKMSGSEKSRKAAERLGGLMSGFFSDEEFSEDEGRQLLSNLKVFVGGLKNFTDSDLESNAKTLAFQKLNSATHGQNVAAYCALFGMALGLPKVESLKLGGLLHDIGKSDLQLNAVSEPQYKNHPVAGESLLLSKKMNLPSEVLEMVRHHHEHTDGSGFPDGKKGAEISAYAKVCAFANEFDKLTSLRTGYPQLTPAEAMARISGSDGEPALPIYDSDFHAPLLKMFVEKTTLAERAQQLIKEDELNEKNKSASSVGETIRYDHIKKKGRGGEREVSKANNRMASIQRLLATKQFYREKFLPNLEFDDPAIQDEVNEISRQLTVHFDKLVKNSQV